MKSDEILNTIPKLQKLNTKSLALVSNAIDSCLALQALEHINSEGLKQLTEVKN